jgi:hypothetical protein
MPRAVRRGCERGGRRRLHRAAPRGAHRRLCRGVHPVLVVRGRQGRSGQPRQHPAAHRCASPHRPPPASNKRGCSLAVSRRLAAATLMLMCWSRVDHTAAAAGCLEAAEVLVACGLALEAVNREGATPLFVAAQHGDTGMTRVLLSHGADFTFARAHVRSHPPRPAHRFRESRGRRSIRAWKCWVCVAPRSSVTQKPEFSYRTRVGRARTFNLRSQASRKLFVVSAGGSASFG